MSTTIVQIQARPQPKRQATCCKLTRTIICLNCKIKISQIDQKSSFEHFFQFRFGQTLIIKKIAALLAFDPDRNKKEEKGRKYRCSF